MFSDDELVILKINQSHFNNPILPLEQTVATPARRQRPFPALLNPSYILMVGEPADPRGTQVISLAGAWALYQKIVLKF